MLAGGCCGTGIAGTASGGSGWLFIGIVGAGAAGGFGAFPGMGIPGLVVLAGFLASLRLVRRGVYCPLL